MKVAVLVYDGVFDSGLAAVLDVLDGANAMAEADEARSAGPQWTVTTVGFAPQIRTGAGHLVETAPIDHVDEADLLVVPALGERRPDALLAAVGSEALAPVRELVADAAGRGLPIASACTGTFLLAEAGVLGGLRATTSWWLAPVFRDRYPEVELDQSRMLVSCGGVTTAGAAFGHVDLALSVVRAGSPALADLVARYLVIDERPSQSAYTIPSALAQNDPTVAAFERWVRERLAQPVSIPEAAQALGVSNRTLQRSVQRVLGTSPIRFVQDLRVEQASHLLRTTDLSLEVIARRVGYENANTLRVLLRERTGRTTSALRGV
ncbi:GlxA family transcriptional regulator [Streptacidiphilus fuscans]|uniref:Helix-turn-helix domain-containing protein n=1 Tax=Streptacidiphilus fuscans TaxID=2789292 RepID=A0A931FHP6_9ACTN|nr:helix-turn-helix domain-containing protein [Streptacidiphilus fuscans]MBF9072051.1 helix-turn-helix domain-containing protein [Streptacidiphilus fuscans]